MPLQKVEKIWMDGELVNWDDANVHILTHTLHYGSGVFEGIRAYETVRGPAVWHLDAHLDRMYMSAGIYFMEIPYSRDELTEAVKQTIRSNGLQSCYIRPIAFRGYGEMGVSPLANTVDVSKTVRDALPGIESKITGDPRFTVVFDQAPYIQQSIDSLAEEGLLGLGFAVVVILVFLLSVRSTIVLTC